MALVAFVMSTASKEDSPAQAATRLVCQAEDQVRDKSLPNHYDAVFVATDNRVRALETSSRENEQVLQQMQDVLRQHRQEIAKAGKRPVEPDDQLVRSVREMRAQLNDLLERERARAPANEAGRYQEPRLADEDARMV